jgi:alpha-galactosidase
MPIKVAFIGAGSIGFTRGLVRDLLAVPELQDTHFAFTDISRRNLEMIARLCEKDIRENNLPARITATLERRRVLAEADYVFNVSRIGGLEAFQHDIDIPLKYGIDQCVGDTLCAGGIMYGQRNIPCILEFCKDMREVSKRDVLFMNYANPMAMNTWAALDHGGVRMLGLCHGVEGAWRQIAAVLGVRNHTEVEITAAGINHQTWFVEVVHNGRRIGGEELLAAFERHPIFRRTEKVRIDVLRRFGYYSTESNGHLSEYVPWYRKRTNEIRRWIDLSSWINGETGGYLRTCREGRYWFRTDFSKWMKAGKQLISPENRGHEHGSYIIEALETGRCYRGHFNVRNNGCITNLPPDCVVEVPCYVDKLGIHVPRIGDLPLACAATCQASINVQRMSKDAAVRGDVSLLKQAMLHDPLTAAVCNPEEIWQLADEMLVALAPWLPQYRQAIPAARKRLAQARRQGTYRGTHTSKGAARLTPRDIQLLAGEWAREKNATILQSFTATDLQSDETVFRRNDLPPAGLFTRRVKAVQLETVDGFVDARPIHTQRHGLLFLRTSFNARTAGAGRLYYGADGPVKVWVNGAVADCRPKATNPATAGEYEAKVRWKRGTNDVVFALVTNHGNAWGIYAAATLAGK